MSNTFGIEGWTPDETVTIENGCSAWCTALLWIVPAKVGGKWRLGDGDLVFDQQYQVVKGTLNGNADLGRQAPRRSNPLHGRRRRIHGARRRNRIEGTVRGGGPVTMWTAVKAS